MIMRSIHQFFICTFFLLALGNRVSAQVSGISGCNGTRYKTQVFSEYQIEVISYGSNINSGGGLAQPLYMDVYTPKNDTATLRPAIVLAHGGSFVFGDKSDMAAYCIDLAKRGYVAVSVQYRLWPIFQLGAPDSTKLMSQAIMAMGDMKAVIRSLRMDAATTNKYKVHPDWIFCGGYSAGAVTALHVAQLNTTDVIPPFIQTAINTLGGINGNTGTAANQTYPSDVKAVMSLSGGLYQRDWIDANDVPMYSIHGTADDVVFYTVGVAAGIVTLHGSGNLHQRADQVGITHKLTTVPGGGHTDVYFSTTYAPVLNTFVNETLTEFHDMFCGTTDTQNPTEVKKTLWSVAPNPVSDVLFVQLPADMPRAKVQVYHSNGQLALSTWVENGKSIGLNHLPTGLYFARIVEQQSYFQAIRFVKD
jgi:para-nitrobenzyl esterase